MITRNKKRMKLFAILTLAILVGSVAAVIFSNTLTGTIDLKGEYPLALSWENSGPWNDNFYVFLEASDVLLVENTDSSQGYAYELLFEISAIMTLDISDVVILVDSEAVVFSVVSGDLIGILDIGTVNPSTTHPWPIEIIFNAESPIGIYSFSISAHLVAI